MERQPLHRAPSRYRPGWRQILGLTFGFGVCAVFLAIGGWMLPGALARPNAAGLLATVWVAIPFIAVAWMGVSVIRDPHTIRIRPDGMLEFVGLISRKRLHARELRSVEEGGDDDGTPLFGGLE